MASSISRADRRPLLAEREAIGGAGRPEPAARPEALGGGFPLVGRPATRLAQEPDRRLPGGLVEDQGLDRPDPVIDELGEVAVPAELAKQRLRVPEDEVWWLGPGKPGVCGEEGPSLRPFGGALGRPACEGRRLLHVVRVDRLAEHPVQRLACRRGARLEDPGRRARLPDPLHRRVDERRREVEEGGHHGVGIDRTHGRGA